MSFSLLTSSTSGTGSAGLLDILYGKSTASGADPVLALQQAVKNRDKGVAAAAAEPLAKREIAAFRAAVAKAPDVKTLLANPIARKVLLTANGLGAQADYGALARKALLSDTSKAGSLASKLGNKKWLAAAKTYDFAHKGLAVLRDPKVLNSIADGYAEVAWRTSLDSSTPGLSNAIDFRARAAGITSVDQILGDAALREVVTTALGIPKQIAFQTIQAQEKAISDRIDIGQFKKPIFVEQFTRRYLVAAGAAAANVTQSAGLLA